MCETRPAKYAEISHDRFFISPSPCHNYCQGTATFLVTYDGSHLRNNFGGTLFVFVYRDAQHEISPLAWGVGRGETAGNSAWMMGHFRHCFPNLDVLMQDQGSGFWSDEALESLQAENEGEDHIFVAQCARHAGKKAAEKFKHKGVQDLVFKFAKQRTRVGVNGVLEEAKQKSQKLHDYLEARIDQLTLCRRIESGLMSGGIVLNNNAESMNYQVLGQRLMPPIQMIICLLEDMEQKHSAKATKWAQETNLIPPYVVEERHKSMEKQRNYKFANKGKPSIMTQTQLEGMIKKKNGKEERVFIELGEDGKLQKLCCPCRHFEDLGTPCARAFYLLKWATTNWVGDNCPWDYRSLKFVHARLSTAHLKAAFPMNVQWPQLKMPYINARSELKAMMEENGSLFCYPPEIAPRAQDARKVKKKIKNQRKKASFGDGGKTKRQVEDAESDAEDQSDNAMNPEDSDSSSSYGVFSSDHADSAPDIQGSEGKTKKHRVMHCSRCGEESHTKPTCENSDISFLLKSLGLYPKVCSDLLDLQLDAENPAKKHKGEGDFSYLFFKKTRNSLCLTCIYTIANEMPATPRFFNSPGKILAATPKPTEKPQSIDQFYEPAVDKEKASLQAVPVPKRPKRTGKGAKFPLSDAVKELVKTELKREAKAKIEVVAERVLETLKKKDLSKDIQVKSLIKHIRLIGFFNYKLGAWVLISRDSGAGGEEDIKNSSRKKPREAELPMAKVQQKKNDGGVIGTATVGHQHNTRASKNSKITISLSSEEMEEPHDACADFPKGESLNRNNFFMALHFSFYTFSVT